MRKHFAFLLSIIIVATCGFYVQASDIAPEAPLSAQWVPNAVKITFDSNGGGTAPATQVYTYGIERSLPNAGSMSKSGYHFIGWAETPTATSPTWYGGNISSEAFGYADETKAIAKTLYAVWEEDDTATAADVKKDLTAHINDTQVSGTMPTYDNITKYLNAGESYTLEPGYYAGGTIQGNTLASQTSGNASASTIRSGYTAWVNGSKITGTYTPPTPGLSAREYVIFGQQNGWALSDISIIYINGTSVSTQHTTTDGKSSVGITGHFHTYYVNDRGYAYYSENGRAVYISSGQCFS